MIEKRLKRMDKFENYYVTDEIAINKKTGKAIPFKDWLKMARLNALLFMEWG